MSFLENMEQECMPFPGVSIHLLVSVCFSFLFLLFWCIACLRLLSLGLACFLWFCLLSFPYLFLPQLAIRCLFLLFARFCTVLPFHILAALVSIGFLQCLPFSNFSSLMVLFLTWLCLFLESSFSLVLFACIVILFPPSTWYSLQRRPFFALAFFSCFCENMRRSCAFVSACLMAAFSFSRFGLWLVPSAALSLALFLHCFWLDFPHVCACSCCVLLVFALIVVAFLSFLFVCSAFYSLS